MLSGVLVLDKPAGMSSAAAVDHVKKRLGAKRAGHGGTLDPIATGVLPICLDEATKIAAYLLADDKEYEAEALLGVDTDTLDRTGQITATRPAEHITQEMIERVLAARVGDQQQLPPMFSAIKQEGVRMYHRARRGEEVERTPRSIRIDKLELLDFAPPLLRFRIACSKGTYVRSVVADVGTDLGTGAHMTNLRRTRSGIFTIEQAHNLDRLDNCRLVGLVEAARLPRVTAPAALIQRIRDGLQMPPEVFSIPPEIYERFMLLDDAGKLISIAHVEDHRVHYDRVFAP